MSPYKKYFLISALLVTFILTSVSFINYKVDPANLFGADATYYKKIALLIASNKNVLIKKENFDERLLQKSIIEKLDKPINVVVLGSSRVRSLGKYNLCPDKQVYNFAVSGAVLKDDLAITQILLDHHKLPKVIVIGLDPWLLNQANSEVRWKSLKIEYNRMLENIGYKKPSVFLSDFYTETKLTQLISWSYFVASIHELRWWGRNRNEYEATTQMANNEYSIKYADGSYRPPLYRQAMDAKDISKMAHMEISHYPLYSLGGFSHISLQLKNIFLAYLDFLIQHHVKVIFYFPPYEKTEENFIRNDSRYRQVLSEEALFRQIAKQDHIMMVGDYFSSKLGLAVDDFMDGKHLKYPAFEKIFTQNIKEKICK